jgi:glycosyltransferase involved in cell wall biosynthesis
MKLLVMIPALNESAHIGEVIKRIPRQIAGVDLLKVLVVDDGSKDNTGIIAESFGATVIHNYITKGLGVVFDQGLQHALSNGFDLLVNIDADGQFSPEDIPQLIQPIIKDKADFVTASRFIDKNLSPKMPFMKFIGNRGMSYLLSSLTGQKFYDVSCGFRAYSKEAMLNLNLQGEFTYTHEVFLSLAFKKARIVEVPVSVAYNKKRRSRLASNLWHYGLNTAKIILRTYRDYKPFKFFFGLTVVFFLSGSFFEGVMFMNFLKTGSFSPQIWAGFVGAAFFFCAIIFLAIGILADMYVRTKNTQDKILYLLKKDIFSRKD